MKKFAAARCEHCPLCRYARGHPDTIVGRAMYFHGKYCPFWKAWEEIYGVRGSKADTAADPSANR